MADDPRIEPLARALFEQTRPSWSWDRPPRNHHVAQDYWRAQAAALLSEALDPVDPLRALLADERQALETLTRAWWDGEFGAGSWDRDVARGTQARQLDAMRPVLAALREVAGL